MKIHRKSAVRLLSAVKNKKPKGNRGRRRIYNDFVIQDLKKLWIDMGKSSIDGYLKPYRAQYRRHWNSGTQAGKFIKMMIPLKPLDYNVTGIGHVETDTVHHCGRSLTGAYALTLTVTDIITSWTECRAMCSKSMEDRKRKIGLLHTNYAVLLPFEKKQQIDPDQKPRRTHTAAGAKPSCAFVFNPQH